jgi:hypothetical protein
VAVNEIVTAVGAALNGCSDCCGDCNADGSVTVDEVVAVVNIGLGGCRPEPTPSPTTQPTRTPTPAPTEVEVTGPGIGFLGIATGDNRVVTPVGTTQDGVAIYQRPTRSGFRLVVEAGPGPSGRPPGIRGTADSPTVVGQRPDLQVQADRALGDGSVQVCDDEGGVPGFAAPDFGPSAAVTAALSDFACRFETQRLPCTVDALGNPAFVDQASTRQYCALVGREIAFPPGNTLLTVRILDTAGNPGAQGRIILRVP